MNDQDDLRSMLAAADAGEPLSASRPPTVGQLRQRLTNRRRRGAVAALGAAAVVTAAGWLALAERRSAAPVSQSEIARQQDEPVNIEQALREVAQLDREAERAMATARRLQAARRAKTARDEMLGHSPIAENMQLAAGHVDRAAMIGIAHADRLRESLSDARPAIELYRHILELFPDSRWSAVALERIKAASMMN